MIWVYLVLSFLAGMGAGVYAGTAQPGMPFKEFIDRERAELQKYK